MEMKPLTLAITLNTYREGVHIANMIREFDDTADVHLHEARKGTDWFIRAHICIPAAETVELRKQIRATGAALRVREPDGPKWSA